MKKKRIILDVGEETASEIDKEVKLGGYRTRVNFAREALSFYGMLRRDKREKGLEIYGKDKEGNTYLYVPLSSNWLKRSLSDSQSI